MSGHRFRPLPVLAGGAEPPGDVVARGVGQPEILHDHHAVADVEQLRDGERRVRALRRVPR
jgi:hypothetical protein